MASAKIIVEDEPTSLPWGNSMYDIKVYRDFIKDSIRKTIDFRNSDQNRGIPVPPLEEHVDLKLPRIALPDRSAWDPVIKKTHLVDAIGNRRSRRNYNDEFLKIEELAFLLWATQGQRQPGKQPAHFRTVPSAGARLSRRTCSFIGWKH